jgi:superfamily II DNA helicase RecQ
MEKDTREAIRSVVGSLPNINQLKLEQEQALLSFVGGHEVVALLPTGFGKS